MSETRGVFKTGVSAVIYTNTSKLVKGNTVRDKFLVMADSVVFMDSDANVAGGYLKIHSTDVNVDVSFIKSTSPTGKFLKDNGTWDTLTASTINGTFIFSSGQGIDSTGAADIDVLNIGTTNANIINYGNSSTKHNFFGTAIYEQQVNSFVTDKLITLNNGGSEGSGIGVGFEVIEGGSITGYFKTNGGRKGFSLKSPINDSTVDLNTDLLSDNRVYNFPNSSGTFLVGSVSEGMVAYGGTGSLVGSSKFTWNGTFLKVDGSTFLGGTTDPTAWLHIAAGSTTKTPLRLTSGPLKTVLEAGAIEFLSERLYFTRTTGPTRETFAFMSDIASAVSPGGSTNYIQYNSGGAFTGVKEFVFENGSARYFKVNGSALFGLDTAANPGAFVDIAASTTARASLRLRPTSAPPDVPADGDMWLTSSFLFVRINGSTKRVNVS